MAQIIRFHRTGGPEVLQLENLPPATPRNGEVRLTVEAIGLNRADILFRKGKYLETPSLPSRLGYEATGIIDAIGDGVTGLKIGDRVSTIPAFSMREYGVYGDSAVVPAHAITSHPPNLTPTESAASWMQYLTGYFALFELGNLRPGQHVLITAASSSTGLAAIQLTKTAEAIAIATTRTHAKKQSLLDAGAEEVIVTEEGRFVDRIMELTKGRGVDIIYDPIAGPGLRNLGEVITHHGTIIVYGALSPEPTIFPIYPALIKSFKFYVYKIFDFTGNPILQLPRNEEAFNRGKSYVYEALESGKFKPIIDRTFPLKDVTEAHRYMESNRQRGKIVVMI